MAGVAVTSDGDFFGLPGALRNLVINFNKLAQMVAFQTMPGVLLSDPSVKAGTTAATAWRSEAFTFTFRGLEVSAAAQEKALTATTHDVAASKEAWFALSVQSNGTSFTITKAADQTIGTKVLPTTPDNEVLVGRMQIITGSGGIFDASTHDLSVSNNIASIAFEDAEYVSKIGVNGVAISS